MKKQIYLTSLFLIAYIVQSTSLQAQFIVGADLGINSSRLVSKQSYSNPKATMGFRGGITLGYKLDTIDAFQIIAQILYNQKGGRKNEIEKALIFNNQVIAPQITYSEEFKLNYVEVPVMLRFNKMIMPKQKIGLFVNAGPYLRFLTSGKVKYKYEGESDEENLSKYYKKSKKIEFGMLGGLGLFYPLNLAGMNAKILIESRYTFGLTNVVPEDLSRTRYFSFSAGLILELGKKKASSVSKPTSPAKRGITKSSPRL